LNYPINYYGTLTRLAQIRYGQGISLIFGMGGRWVYLAIVADLYARRVVSYSVSDKADSHLVISALDMAWS
jgi:transposase InsO family protein